MGIPSSQLPRSNPRSPGRSEAWCIVGSGRPSHKYISALAEYKGGGGKKKARKHTPWLPALPPPYLFRARVVDAVAMEQLLCIEAACVATIVRAALDEEFDAKVVEPFAGVELVQVRPVSTVESTSHSQSQESEKTRRARSEGNKAFFPDRKLFTLVLEPGICESETREYTTRRWALVGRSITSKSYRRRFPLRSSGWRARGPG